jgi:DNA primase
MSFDALTFLRDNGVPYWEEGENVSPGWVAIRCPMCSDHSNHGGFNIAGGYYSCWKCGGHKLAKVVASLLHISWDQAEGVIYDYSAEAQLRGMLNKRREAKAATVDLPGEQLNKFHRKYLSSRGFDPDYIERKYGVLGTGPVGDYCLRIIIPIMFHGRVVSFTGRDITGKQKIRYKTLSVEKSVMNPKHVLYNMDNCREDWVVVVEGPLDVWRMGDNFVAGLGTQLTDQQLRLLFSYKKVIFLFDSELEAQKRAEKYATTIGSLGVDTHVIDLETDKDPGELPDHLVQEVRWMVRQL